MGEDEFEALYLEVRGLLFTYAAKRVPPQSADDVVGETFEVAWMKRDEFPEEPEARIRWVWGIGKKKVLQEVDRLRRKHHDNRFAEDYGNFPSSEALIDDLVTDRIVAARVYRRLTAWERKVVDVALLPKISRDEAAKILGISVDTLNKQVSRLRKKIRELETEEGDSDAEGGQS